MLVDDVTIRVIAGAGGDGTVAFNRNKMELGPTGASGGNGGSVWCEGVADIGALQHWRHTKEARAKSGQKGGSQYRDGEDGDDYSFPVPVGTVLHNLDTGEDTDVTAIGHRVRLARGGAGGRGNYHFRSSTNTSPRTAQPGKPGQQFSFRLELKLIADVGLIGMPNAGKSSLLNELTRAHQRVANYPFTTLEPGLGAHFDLIIADIPGLIEGASSGKGLGIKFLRHVERTRVLLHLVSAESEHPVADWRAIRAEMGAYNPALLEKPEFVLLSKTDLAPSDIVLRRIAEFRAAGVSASALSIHDAASLERVQSLLRDVAAAKHV